MIPRECSGCGVSVKEGASVTVEIRSPGPDVLFHSYCITTSDRPGCWPQVFAAMLEAARKLGAALPCEATEFKPSVLPKVCHRCGRAVTDADAKRLYGGAWEHVPKCS